MALHFQQPIVDEPAVVECEFVLPEKLALGLAALAEAMGTSARDELITAVALHLDATRGLDPEESS